MALEKIMHAKTVKCLLRQQEEMRKSDLYQNIILFIEHQAMKGEFSTYYIIPFNSITKGKISTLVKILNYEDFKVILYTEPSKEQYTLYIDWNKE
jgi:hypothetical protein